MLLQIWEFQPVCFNLEYQIYIQNYAHFQKAIRSKIISMDDLEVLGKLNATDPVEV